MNIQIEIPRLNEISTERLIRFLDIYANEKASDDDKMFAAFEHLCGINKANVKRLNLSDALKVYAAIQKALDTKGEVIRGFQLNGRAYGMIPNMEAISTGEYADLDTFLTPAFAGEIKHDEAYKFLSVLYRPIIQGTIETTYKIEPYEDVDNWELMKECPSDVYINAASFFLNLRLVLLKGFRSFLEANKEQLLKSEPTLQLDGGGLPQLIDLQAMTLYDGIGRLSWNLPPLSHSSVWKQTKRKSKKQKEKNVI